MSGIQRYDIGFRVDASGASMIYDDHGDYVLHDDHAAEIASLRTETEALRVDAMRYRWLRDRAPDEWSVLLWIDSVSQLVIDDSLMDSKIDEAMGADA